MTCVLFSVAMEMRIKSGRSNLFRTRKQNTSRPPSMHVDDFMRVSLSMHVDDFLRVSLSMSRRRLYESEFIYARRRLYESEFICLIIALRLCTWTTL